MNLLRALSILCNAAIAVGTLLSILILLPKSEPKSALFRYFTVLSNALCAISALGMVIGQLLPAVPMGLLVCKYIGTCAVMVTFLTVMLFLGPTTKDYKGLLTGPNLFLHMLLPLLAVVSFCAWENSGLPFWVTLLGAAPVPLYGGWYLYHVILGPEKKRWEDFYGFNRGGKWGISFVLMAVGAYLIAIGVWAVPLIP